MPRVQAPTRPVPGSGFELRPAHQLVWARIRALFPEHAHASSTWAGGLAITWTLEDDPTGTRSATPILVRLEPEWSRNLQAASDEARDALLAQADAQVRQGMQGYQPSTRMPQARVIVVG